MRTAKTLSVIMLICTGLMIGIGWGISECTAAPANISGKWLGTIKVPNEELRFAFEISETKEGGYTALGYSIDQGAMNIPMSTVTVTGDSLRIELESAFAYEGRLQPDGNTITGNWIQGEVIPFEMKRVDNIPGINRPQTPKKPYPYIEEEVTYENRTAGVTLAGTLTMPKGKGPFPAVVLISGSGQNNRDEEFHSHRPFMVLADYLTRRGIAVLRFDDRGVGGSTGDFSKATTGDFADDALAGIEFLKGRKEIDPKQMGLIGHSEGGMIGPIAATRSPDVAFIVMLGGPGEPLADTLVGQKLRRANWDAPAEDALLALIRFWYGRLYALVAEDTDNEIAEKKIRALHATLTADEKKKLEWPDDKLDGKIAESLSPWMRYFIRYDTQATLMKVKCPVLALNGGKDCQIPPKENLGGIERALKAGGNRDFTIRELPGLNHFFQTCKTGGTSEYGGIEETMSPLALQTVSEWITAQTGTGKTIDSWE